MTKRIFRSICFVALTVFLASVVLIMGVLYEYFSQVQQEQLKMQTRLAAQGVANEGILYFRDLEVSNHRITWIGEDGTVLYDSKTDTEEMENHLEREEVKEALNADYGESRRYSSTLLARSFYSAQKLPDGTVLRLSVSRHSILTLLFGMMQPICIVFVIAFVLSIVLAIRVSAKIVEPLNEVDLENPLSNEDYDELSPLLRRIDSQQKQLRRQKEELFQKEKELEKAEQIRREFTANVSHELKTPLHSISGYAELLKNDMVQEQDRIPFAGKIYGEAQRMIHLVEDIINLSHLDEGAEDMRWENVNLRELAEKAVQSLQPEAEAAGVTLELSAAAVSYEGIPQLLYSIIYNLCDNAIKYNHEGGSVFVDIYEQGQAVVLSVKDTGIGIAPEHQERIFERFYRVDKSHSKAVGGTGLGLSIVKHAAKIHHAKTEVKSAVGEGTEITVILPR